MDSSIWAILLLLAGLLLIATEVFIPSGGLIAIAAAACFVFSLLSAWQAWWPSHAGYFWGYLGVVALVIPVVATMAFRVWPHTPIGRKAILSGPAPDEMVPFQEEEQHLRALLGRIGETATVLNPAGMVQLGNERIHAQSEGMIVEARVPVRVIGVRGNCVIVRQHVPSAAQEAKSDPSTEDPLDFDMA